MPSHSPSTRTRGVGIRYERRTHNRAKRGYWDASTSPTRKFPSRRAGKAFSLVAVTATRSTYHFDVFREIKSHGLDGDLDHIGSSSPAMAFADIPVGAPTNNSGLLEQMAACEIQMLETIQYFRINGVGICSL